jgi:D-3-phosphoglycerate dehydrogenase
MSKQKPIAVVIAGSYDEEEDRVLRSAGIEVKIHKDEINESAIGELRNADALILGISQLSAEVIALAPQLKIIARQGVGYDNVDIIAANNAGIYVTNTPGVNAQTVAEFTLSAMISLTRHIHDSWHYFHSGGWRKPSFWGQELWEMHLGIIGFGNIGKLVSRLGRAFGMTISVFDPYISPFFAESEGVSLLDLHQLLPASDIITIHCSLTENTRNLIREKELEMMKRGAYLVNMARGEIVNTEDLLKALDKGILSGAAIDAFTIEPPTDRRLVEHPCVLATPHIAGWGIQARRKMCVEAAKQVVMTLNGQRPTYAINRPFSPISIYK